MTQSPLIPSQILPSVSRVELLPRKVTREFFLLVDSGATVRVAGTAKNDPASLVRASLNPKHKIELFETRFYFTDVLQVPELRFFVCYVVQVNQKSKTVIYPRIVYKDLSLIWRSASHFTSDEDGIWVGKGDVRDIVLDGDEMIVSDESTTDLPLEMQSGVESLLDFSKRPNNGDGVLDLVLRKAPIDRVEPYRDFVVPRQKAAQNSSNLINQGRPIARFTRKNDPTSLKFVSGYEPDFQKGIIERSESRSKLYGGTLQRFRILSSNRKIHYYFLAGTKHVWLAPPQALTTELSSYGVRTIDVEADDNLFIPGYEYHHYEDTANGPELYSQIPQGFVGEACPVDDAKADASPWLNKLPIVQEFRRRVLSG